MHRKRGMQALAAIPAGKPFAFHISQVYKKKKKKGIF
jgi:hypothetical protein